MVPGLPLDAWDFCDFSELIRSCADQGQLALFGNHQQQILIGEQNQLAVAVAPAFPLALTVLQIDTREDTAIKAERKPFVNNEVVEVRLEPVGSPFFSHGPAAGIVCD